MLAQSDRVAEVLLFIFLSSMTFLPFGCSKEEEKDIRRVVAENSCKEIVGIAAIPERTKKLARKVLTGWGNKTLDPEPMLVHAGYGRKPSEDYSQLFLTMSDEDFDIAGFCIREFHKQLDSNVTVIEEEYPIFPEPKIGHFQFVLFKERKSHSQRKDEKAWNNYLNSGVDRLMIYRRREYPVIWISLPDPPRVKVEIWIYDFADNKSQPVPLEYGLPRIKKHVGRQISPAKKKVLDCTKHL